MATICQARTAANVPCSAAAKVLDGQRQFCGTHHKVKLRTDPAYAALVQTYNADPELVAARAAVAAAETAYNAAAAGDELANAHNHRFRALQALERALDAARERQHPGVAAAERAAAAAAAAAAVIARRDARDAAWRAAEAAARPRRAADTHAAYVRTRAAKAVANDVLVTAIFRERAAQAALRTAETAHAAAPDDDVALLAVAAAVVDVEERHQATIAAAREQMHARLLFREARRHWTFIEQWAAPLLGLAIAPAVAPAAARAVAPIFQRDPAGGINLRAFAADSQSVHRSGVVSSTEAAIHRLLERPLAADQRTLVEATAVLPAGGVPNLRAVLQNDYNLTHGFNVPYAKVLDHVWGTIRTHEHKAELERRFTDEIRDGFGMCQTGKMTRLVNVLAGFDEAVGELMPPAELFRNRIALLTDRPLAEREPAAKDLFREFAIPETEQAAWLEPLLEA